MKRALLAVALAFVVGCTPPPKVPENCSNGVDDDGNGKIDCDDPACAGTVACTHEGVDAGYYGTCAKCGQTCAKQLDCLSNQANTQGYLFDLPLEECLPSTSGPSGLKCSQLNQGIHLPFKVDTTAWTGVSVTLRSMNVRFISKTAVDGSPVSCATVTALATGTTQTDADQIERSGKFNLLAWDTTALTCAPGYTCTEPFMPTGTGSDFLIWVELWSGPRDGTTKLPTGTRLGKPGCFETGPEVAPITAADDSPADGGAAPRAIQVTMPSPQ